MRRQPGRLTRTRAKPTAAIDDFTDYFMGRTIDKMTL
jgi:hypothetical protein